jgi:hypothetical protein
LPIDQLGIPVTSMQSAGEPLGRVISVRGSQASVGLPAPPADAADQPAATVGRFLGIRCGKSLLIGVITDVSVGTQVPDNRLREQGCHATALIDLVGEIKEHGSALAFPARHLGISGDRQSGGRDRRPRAAARVQHQRRLGD